MSLCTPPSLPHTPFQLRMNATKLPPLPSELMAATWSWRHPKLDLPTPPLSTALPRRLMAPKPSLPSIAHFDRRLPPRASQLTPPVIHENIRVLSVTPPDDSDASTSADSSSRLPTFQESFAESYDQPVYDDPMDDYQQDKPHMPPDAPHLVDWLDFTRKRSAHFIAEKTCEMICYLWFAPPAPPSHQYSSRSHSHSPPFLHRTTSATTALQLTASPVFVQFMQKLLETTQVSQSVIVLSLHYIYRLKERNSMTSGQSGSEFRIAVAALMMANKFLDDNTYTNKTWSEVSGIELPDINKMEREFLMGVDFDLYVDEPTYDSWLNLLKGLVMAKEKDSRHYRRSRGSHRTLRQTGQQSAITATRTYTLRHRPSSHRARSTSPTAHSATYPFSFYAPPAGREIPANTDCSPTPQPGLKRSACDAFSPTSASFPEPRPLKRPTSMSLVIPDFGARSGPPSANSSSPLESLKSFAKMSLGSSPVGPPMHSQNNNPNWVMTPSRSDAVPQTLVAAYRVDDRPPTALPQHLYFYSLTSSPMESDEENRRRKTKLRSYQPPPSTASSYYYPPQPSYPMDIQSASTSPHEVHMSTAPPTLPHFNDTVWSRQTSAPTPRYDRTPQEKHHHHHHHHHRQRTPQYQPTQESHVPSAPFANAGPPGVQFYTIPTQRTSPGYYDWSRGRRL